MPIDIQAVMDLLQKNAPTTILAAVFAWLWWDERKKVKQEREETRRERDEGKMLQEKVIKLSAVVLAARHEEEDK